MTQNKNFEMTTLKGNSDLSQVEVGDHVQFHRGEGQRAIIFPADKVLTSDRQSLHEASDGSSELLDGSYAVKLGGAVIGLSEIDK